ncbi:anthranilate synthase component II [Kineobactrum salinum]|uniref:Aminodeoxychorismate/anthranilate synthase component II n=1 Tax=Kineobactrum salinum TaxID=2708301 RepID=A0A6C0U7Q2_9GAMM|nr:aminodeoxychorismate/anthranilate synthase component II [Kineobactrum salinum]QIB66485.1 aminodeoxychorismate/anthranilate synthase component II [Kineobactrum salinum]
MILLIDNYDSFVYNLARYVGRLGRSRQVVRNDAITLEQISAMKPAAIILSPGPCTPAQAGICNELILRFAHSIPILGVCLGHQCIGAQFGGRVIRAPRPCHGKPATIEHNQEGVFLGLPNPLEAGRYHSLTVDLTADSPLCVTARSLDDDLIMGVKHREYPLYGVQFHPESVLTPQGLEMIHNFITAADHWNRARVST